MAAYTEALGDEICRLTVDANCGLRHICRQLRQPYSTVNDWIYKNFHGFGDNYARAKQMQIDRLSDEILEIADDDSNDRPGDGIRRAKLRIDARIWLSTNRAAQESDNELDEPKRQVNIIIKKSQPLGPEENNSIPEPHCDQPGSTPAGQSQTSLSSDTVSKDQKGQENTEGQDRSSLGSSSTHLPGLLPKT